MAVTRDVAATRQRVWDVLSDGWTYSGWVVGNSRIRAVSSNWLRLVRAPAFHRVGGQR